MVSEVTQIPSIRGLARLLGRAHTTVGGWLHRPDWPFRPAPPWPLGIVSDIEQWAEDHLQEDRNTEQARPRTVNVAAPGFTLTGNDIAAESTPFHLRPHLTEAQYGTLTMADFESFAHVITLAFKLLMHDRCEELGEGELLEEAPPAYYARLMPDEGDPAQTDRLQHLLNIVYGSWMDKRFTGTPGYRPYMRENAKAKRKAK